MLSLVYAPVFVRQLNKLDENLKEEVVEKNEMFKDVSNHQYLKVHKLHGKLNNRYSFSVNYNYRIIFEYATKNNVNILAIGDHNIYK
ncbi:TPA: type II toxin-antitoxin system mRNA interferase toxin, RelE/StbE family [Candidatus Nomurabacteria bacterium]|nr:type II toxin-antitoxin system mRNA interferase toxin, RelE/StbE family [Candidatus Nomurabacteria bacterium]